MCLVVYVGCVRYVRLVDCVVLLVCVGLVFLGVSVG